MKSFFRRGFMIAAVAAIAAFSAAAFAGPLDYGTTQVGKEVILKAGVPAVGTFTVSPGLDFTRITSSDNPYTQGSAAVSLSVECGGLQVASSSFGMHVGAVRPFSFPTQPGNCKFQLVSKQDIAFAVNMYHGKTPPPAPPPKRR